MLFFTLENSMYIFLSTLYCILAHKKHEIVLLTENKLDCHI